MVYMCREHSRHALIHPTELEIIMARTQQHDPLESRESMNVVYAIAACFAVPAFLVGIAILSGRSSATQSVEVVQTVDDRPTSLTPLFDASTFDVSAKDGVQVTNVASHFDGVDAP